MQPNQAQLSMNVQSAAALSRRQAWSSKACHP